MKKESVLKILNMVGATKIKYSATKDWYTCGCIFAHWKHKGGKDSTPSFGISVNATGQSKCNCFTCGSAGDMFDLVMELRGLNQEDPYLDVNFKELFQIVAAEENEDDFNLNLPDYEDILAAKKGVPLNLFPEEWLNSFAGAATHEYLKTRGISPEIGKLFDARYDSSDQRICFPIRTANGVLAGLQGRAISDTHPLRYKLYDYKGKYNPSVWANENNIDTSNALILAEGWFDIAKIAMVYPNVAGSLTSQISYQKYRRLQDAPVIITFYDFGTGGDHARELVEDYWKKSAIQHIVPHFEVKDPGALDPEDIYQILHEIDII